MTARPPPLCILQEFCRKFERSFPFTFTRHLLTLAAALNQFLMLAALRSLAASPFVFLFILP